MSFSPFVGDLMFLRKFWSSQTILHDIGPYVVIDIPIAGVPVFQVHKESDISDVKTLRRTLLLTTGER